MPTIIQMARHFGVYPSTIRYHVDKGNLPNPETLTDLRNVRYPESIHKRLKGPGTRGGKKGSKTIYGRQIAQGHGGLYTMARYYNRSIANVLYHIGNGGLPDPRVNPVNLAEHPWPTNYGYHQEGLTRNRGTQPTVELRHVEQAIAENTPLIKRVATLEAKIDIIINHLIGK